VLNDQELFLGTRAVHAGQHGDRETGALVAPLFMTSTYEWTPEKMERYQRGDKAGIFTYGRSRNPTQNALQDKLAALYNSEACLVTASGMAAISLAILNTALPGDHVISCKTIYGGTFALFSKIFQEMKIEVTFLEDMSEAALNAAKRPNTKVVYSESVYNPTLELADLECIAAWAKKEGIISIIDNTFLSPYLLNPLTLGINVVVDSATKYINGHGDLLGGSICGSLAFVDKIRSSIYQELGPVPSPFSCWLMLRGLKTLHLRMKAHSENAMEVARWLEVCPEVIHVIYPGLESHPQHALAQRLYGNRGYGGMISFVVGGGIQGGQRVINRLKIAKYAVSLGDLDTMAQQPATMTHGKMEPKERERMGIDDGMIRLSVGVEDIRDIIADLEQALRG
jgi:methionine-gamma-lyase